MDLQALISQVPIKTLKNRNRARRNPDITSLAYDSRQVIDGSVFFAIEGEKTDGHLYLDHAIQKGAVAVASERQPPEGFEQIWIRFKAIRPALAQLANQFSDTLPNRSRWKEFV